MEELLDLPLSWALKISSLLDGEVDGPLSWESTISSLLAWKVDGRLMRKSSGTGSSKFSSSLAFCLSHSASL